MIRLLISDDSAFMRIAIRKMVESEPDIEVVGEAKTGQMCVEMARELRRLLSTRGFATSRRGVPGQMAFENYW